VGAGGVRHPVADALEAYAAEDVVHRERAEQRQHHGGEADAEHVAPERELEDVEADVDAELRVLHAEVAAVAEQQPLAPAALRGEAGEQPDDGGGERDPGAEPRAQQHPVALQRGLLGRVRTHLGPQPVGQPQVAADEQRHAGADHQEQKQAGGEHAGEDLGVADLVEPEPVGPGVDAPPEEGEQDEHPDQDTDGDASAPAHPR